MNINNRMIQYFFKLGIDLTQLEVCEWKKVKSKDNNIYFNVGNLKIKRVEIDNESPTRTYIYYVLVDKDWENFGYSENNDGIMFEYWT